MDAKSRPPIDPQQKQQAPHGLFYALAAYGFWGFGPIFWKQMTHINPYDIMAHRVIWATAFLGIVIISRGQWQQMIAFMRQPRIWLYLAASTFFLFLNWFGFIYAVLTERILETSLGYYLNPLLTVMFGALFLGESMSRLRIACLGLACIGVAVYATSLGGLPVLSLTIATSFGLYGLIRKIKPIDPLFGLICETALMVIPGVVFLAWRVSGGQPLFGDGRASDVLLLCASGLVTALPLLWFGKGVRGLPLTTMGFLQYLAPSCTFLIGVLIYGEPFNQRRFLAFSFIWVSLAIFSWDSYRRLAKRKQLR